MTRKHATLVLSTLAALTAIPAANAAHRGHGRRMVAYDAKDKRYYSMAYAKAHGMHDKGGDPLSLVPMSSLPKEAKESKAMRGARM